MTVSEWIRLILGSIMVFTGLFVVATSVIGNFRFHVVMNRMQAAALGDTMGLFLCILGVCILRGFSALDAKLLLTVFCVWITSPVTSHLILKMEIETRGEDWASVFNDEKHMSNEIITYPESDILLKGEEN